MTRNPPKTDWSSKLNYPSLLGAKSWAQLHPDIQKRFSINTQNEITYKGVMTEVYVSAAGRLLAQLCRVIGTPLALYSGNDVPLEVKVYPNKALDGMTWDRFYSFPNKSVNRVKSTKCIQENIGLVEMVGYGFGMQLKVYEKEHAIFFESTCFFWQLGKFKITIPDLLSPGKTIVYQKALQNRQFEFSLDVTHPILGKVFKQVGVFEETSSQ